MASQYFHLQNQGKVKEKLIVELFDLPINRFEKTAIVKKNRWNNLYI